MTDYNKCPRCGGEIYRERDSMSGTLYLTYSCMSCDWLEEENAGTATWKVLHDDNERQKAELPVEPVPGNSENTSPASAPDVPSLTASHPRASPTPVSRPQASSHRMSGPAAVPSPRPTSEPETKSKWHWVWPYVICLIIGLIVRMYFWDDFKAAFG